MHYVFRSQLELGADGEPRSYLLQVLADDRQERIVAELSNGQYRLGVEARGQSHTRSYPARGAVVVLDNLVAHHYQSLVERYDARGGGTRSLLALVPQKLLRVPVVIQPRETSRGRLDGRDVPVEHLELRAGGQEIHLAVEHETREVLEIEVPRQGLLFLRLGFDRVPPGGSTP